MRQNSIKKCPKQVVYAGEADIIGLESYLMMGLRINGVGLMGFSGQLQIYLFSELVKIFNAVFTTVRDLSLLSQ